MPRYQITTPDGRTAIVEGEAPPTDEDLDYLFSSEGLVDRASDRMAEGAQARTGLIPGEEAAVAGAVAREKAAANEDAARNLETIDPRLGASSRAVDRNPELMATSVALPSAYLAGKALIPTTKAALVGTVTGVGAGYGAEALATKVGLPKGVSRALGIGAGLVGGTAGAVRGFGMKLTPSALRESFESAVSYLPRLAGRGFGRGAAEGAQDVGVDIAHREALREMAKRELGIESAQAAAIREAAARETAVGGAQGAAAREAAAREAALSGAQGAAAREAAAREAGVTAAHGGALRETAARESGMSAAQAGAAREAAMREGTVHAAHGAATREAARRETSRPLAEIARRRLAARAVVPPPAASAAPAAPGRTEAAARLEALLGQALKEGQTAAATREAAKGNRQLAEKILAGIKE